VDTAFSSSLSILKPSPPCDNLSAGDFIKFKEKFIEDDFHFGIILGRWPYEDECLMVFWSPEVSLSGVIFGDHYEVIKIEEEV